MGGPIVAFVPVALGGSAAEGGGGGSLVH
jgi:hypothetical protein